MSRWTGGLGRPCRVCGQPAAYTHHGGWVDEYLCAEHSQTVHQPALFHHAGYGATRRTVVVSCACGWEVTVDVSETRP